MRNPGIDAYEDGGLNAWLKAIDKSLGIWREEVQEIVNEYLYEPEIIEVAKELEINPQNLELDENGNIYFLTSDNNKILVKVKFSQEIKSLGDEIDQLSFSEMKEKIDALPDEQKEQVIQYLRDKYGSAENWENEHPVLVADGGNVVTDVGTDPGIEESLKQQEVKDFIFNPFLTVPKGQLTFDAEGNDNKNSIYYSRIPHVPLVGKSGVTIGRGYDLSQHTKDTIIKDLTSIGLSEDDAKIYAIFSQESNLTGNQAKEKLEQYKDQLPELTLEQQHKLFNIEWKRKEAVVLSIYEKADTVQEYGKVDTENLHPAIHQLIVDLTYRGDYNSATRKLVQPFVANNDLKGLLGLMSDETWWQNSQMTGFDGETYKQKIPQDRFYRRMEFLEEAISNLNQSGQSNTLTQATLGYNKIDPLTGINLSDNSYPGRDRLDPITGASSLDVFVLGNTTNVFYNDSNSTNTTESKNGYAQIRNFDNNIDKIQLHGESNDYVLGSTNKGQAIYLKTSGEDELIGILEGVNNFDLNKNVIYVGKYQ